MPDRRLAWVVLLAALAGGSAAAQDYRVYTEHPRLFLQPRKLGLLQKEKQRQSVRWQQFESLIKSGEALPEPGLANALYSQVSGEVSYCAKAVDWALTGERDVRELALVFDWCQPALTAEKSEALARKMEDDFQSRRGDSSISPFPGRVLAAIALAEVRPTLSELQLRLAMEQWWRGEIAPALDSGHDPFPRDRLLALFEVLHAVRDNLKLDLRDSASGYFRDLPASLLLGFYPSPYRAAENVYYIPAVKGGGQPDVARATLARAAGACLVAYDATSDEQQFLQGWLTQDRFMLRNALGAPYEFLWGNPYQPGLSYYHFPLFFHNRSVGALFLRSSWDEDATWLGYLDGELQVFDENGLKIVTGQPASKPIRIGNAAVYVLSGERSFRGTPPEVDTVFFLGLRPNAAYTVEVQGEKKSTGRTDPGGILPVSVRERPGAEVRIRESSP
jgi:hypothetical protein